MQVGTRKEAVDSGVIERGRCLGVQFERGGQMPHGRIVRAFKVVDASQHQQRYELNSVINNASPLFSCLGYAVLGGLPARVPSEADFTEQFVDASGNPVVTVRVEYQKTYAVSSGINK